MHLTKILFFISSVLLYSCGNNDSVVVSSNGTPKLKLLVSQEDSLLNKSAIVLRDYLKKITDSDFEIVNNRDEDSHYIVLRINDQLKNEEIGYSILSGEILIQGGSGKSVLNSTYTFLEQVIGCRFYAPNAEFIPKQEKLRLKNTNFSYVPLVTTRTVHSRLFYHNPEFADKRKVTKEGFPNYVPGAGVHTFHRLVPSAKYFKNHPEYYALRNGRRVTTQLCLTNPDVLEITIHAVDSMLKLYPDRPVISVSQDDNTQYCTCEDCSAIHKEEGSPSGSMIRFVNSVAEKFPDKTISTLAYQYTRKAPSVVKPGPNVLITLCSIECDRSAPISENCTDFAKDLEEWSKITDNVRIWDYTTQFTNFLAPFPNMHTLKPNINLFVDNNAKWIFEQHSNQPSELFELRSYITANLLWDPTESFDSLLLDFTEGYYGEAGRFVRMYVNRIHDEIESTDFFLYLYGDPSQAFGTFLKPELLKLYNTWYDSAEMVVSEDAELLDRVRFARLSVDYATLELSRKGIEPTLAFSNSDAVKGIKERLSRFNEVTDENKVTMMNEMRYSVEAYLDFYNKTLVRASKNNIAKGKEVTLLSKPKNYAGEDPQTLTDGAYGGANFYSNWLGFEGNDAVAVIDLGEKKPISEVSTAFLKVVNHIVFYPHSVTFSYSNDGNTFTRLATVKNKEPLTRKSPINDIQYFTTEFLPVNARFIKIEGKNMNVAPEWHHGAGLPTWVFLDEVEVR